MKRIGILTGGGDAPGLNAVIRAAWWHDPRRGESRESLCAQSGPRWQGSNN